MVPDAEYFLRMRVLSNHSHTTMGLFYFDLPIGLIIYLLFVQFVRSPLIIHLPAFLRERFNFPIREMHFLNIVILI